MLILGLPELPPDPQGRKFVRATGPEDAQVMLVGEGPGKDEAAQGMAFVGMTGQTLDSYLWRAYLARHTVYVTNLVKYWGGEGNPEPEWEDVLRDWPYLMAEIRMVQPKLIISLGAHATQHLLSGTTASLYSMDALNGKPVWVELKDAGWKGWVMPAFHPSAGLYNAHMAGLTYQALQRAKAFLDSGMHLPESERFAQCATEVQYQVLRSGTPMADVVLANLSYGIGLEVSTILPTDTEGYKDRPWCISFATYHGVAWLIPSDDVELVQRFDKARRQSGLKLLLHNSLHDLSVLAAMGIHLAPGEYDDSMVAAFICQSETPKGQGLKPLGFKYADVAMTEFAEVTAEAEEKIAKTYLDQLREGLIKQEVILTVEGRKHPPAKRIKAILDKPKHEKSMRKRWDEVCEENHEWRDITEAVWGKMPRVSWEDVALDSWRKYACADPDVTGRIWGPLTARMTKLNLWQPYRMDIGVIPVLHRMSEVGIRVDQKKLAVLQRDMEAEHARLYTALTEMAGLLGYPELNPNSGDQLAPLVYGALGFSTRRMTKSRKRESVDEKALSGLACHKNPSDPRRFGCRRHHEMGHVFVDMLLEYKEVEKILGSYVVPLWEYIQADGRVHPNWRHTVVVSGRLATNSPNLLAFPAHSVWGKRLRSCLVAGPGKVILSCDQSQIELRVLASEAGDAAMMQVFLDGLDLHDQTAMEIFRVTLEQAQADLDYCRSNSKTINFGVAYGLTAHGLSENLAKMGVMRTDEECQRIIDAWFAARPGVRAYLDEAIAETRRHGFVRDMWDRIRFLPLVWSPVDRIRAEAERQAGNFKIQAGAQGSMKLGMAYYWGIIRPLLESRGIYCEPILQVHDDLMFEVADEHVLEVMPLIEEAVTQAAQERFRVPITCGTKIGKSWGELQKGRIYVREDEEEVGATEAA